MGNRIENEKWPFISAMDVILSRAIYKFMTSSDTSEFAKTESYLSDRNENAIDPTACLDANG